MKKVYLYISFLIVLMLITSSCSSNNDKKEVKPNGPVVLNFATFYEEGVQADAYKDIIRVYEANHKDVKINLISGAVNYDEKIKSTLTTDKGPDILGLQRNKMIEYAKKGNLKDITSFIESQNLKEKYFGVSLGYGKFDNKYYGIGDMPSTVEWFYNTDMFKKLGLSEPKDITELINACSKLKRYTQMPIIIGAKDPWVLSTFFGIATVQTTDTDEFSKAYVSDDKLALEKLQGMDDAVNIVYKLTKSGAINSNYIEDYDYAASIEAFVKGKAAILPMGSWAIDRIEKDKPKGFNYKVFDKPIMLVQSPKSMQSATAVQVISINEKSKHPKEAAEFLAYLVGDEAQKIFYDRNGVSGLKSVNIEGKNQLEQQILKHLELTDENSIMFIDNVSNRLTDITGNRLLQLINGSLKPVETWKLITAESRI